MAQNKTPGRNSRAQGSKPRGSKSQASSNRGIVLALAGFTALAILVIAAFAILSTGGLGGSSGEDAENFTPHNQDLLSSGTQAPEFTTDTVGGGSVSVGGGGEGYKATMLVLFATWCPHCQNEAPTIAELEKQYKDLRVVMVSVPDEQAGWPQGDSPEEVRQFVNNYGIEGPAAYDPSVGKAYKVTGTPTTYILDGNGKITFANSGETPKDVLSKQIEEALS